MSITIGHASINENGKSTGGVQGDQTKKEVCTRSWYAKNWTYILRCRDNAKAELMAKACELACNNDYIGYDQSKRNTLRTEAVKCNFDISKIKAYCSCDCSSLMAVCAECAGINIKYSGGNAPTTSTMLQAFLNTGLFDVYSDSKYLTSDKYLKRGDILVKTGSHTVMVLSDGSYTEKVYEVGKTYTTDNNLYIRQEPFGEKIKHNCLDVSTQRTAYFDDYGYAILKRGTSVKCLNVVKLVGSTWLLISAGWICANENGKEYIK